MPSLVYKCFIYRTQIKQNYLNLSSRFHKKLRNIMADALVFRCLIFQIYSNLQE